MITDFLQLDFKVSLFVLNKQAVKIIQYVYNMTCTAGKERREGRSFFCVIVICPDHNRLVDISVCYNSNFVTAIIHQKKKEKKNLNFKSINYFIDII